jgi:hypothetical protein
MAEKIYAHEYMLLDLARASQWHWSLFSTLASGSLTAKSYIYKCRGLLQIQRASSVMHFLHGSDINSNAAGLRLEGFKFLLKHFPKDPVIQKMKLELFDSIFGDGSTYRMVLARAKGYGGRNKSVFDSSEFDLA